MTTDDYTDPTKWMELPPAFTSKLNHCIPPHTEGTSFIDKEFISRLNTMIPAFPKPTSPGESGFDIED